MRVNPKQTILVRRPRDLTVAWAQQVANLHDASIVVSDVAIISVDIGTTTRIRVNVEHNKPERLSKQWFVKLPSLAWQARLITALPRLLQTEVRFYNEIAELISVTKPQFLAAQSKLGRGATLVLEDLSASGAIPGSPKDALSFTQAAMVVKQLAHFHARFWDKVNRGQRYKWLAGSVRQLEDFLGTALALPLMKRGLKLAGELVPANLHHSALHYAKHRRKAMRFLAQAPQTLVHHDCHPGNLFWHQSQEAGLLDWQLVRLGEGIGDVAYFLATALAPETRRLHEASLLGIYAQGLTENGVADVDLNSLLTRYRAHLVYPFEAMIVTLAVGGMMDLDSNKELIRRAALAVEDLNAFAALPV